LVSLLLLCLAVRVRSGSLASLTLPYDSWVSDPQEYLSADARRAITATIDQTLKNERKNYCCRDSSAGAARPYQLAVAIIDSVNDPSFSGSQRAFSEAIFDTWKLGFPECQSGILLFLAIEDRIVHIHTGRDALRSLSEKDGAAVIQAMKPELRAARYDDAVSDAVKMIAAHLSGAQRIETSSFFGGLRSFSSISALSPPFGSTRV
jgi:uncharacterized membrane protein YgcG